MQDLRASLKPGQPEAVAALIEGLAAHYPQAGRTLGDDEVRTDAWLQDMAEYPTDAIESACIQWRRSPERWMPTPGQLIALIEPIVTHRRRLMERGERIIAEHERGGPQTRKPEPVRTEPDPEVVKGFDDILGGLSMKDMER